MAPSRGKGKGKVASTPSQSTAPSSSRRSTRKAKDAVPEVYDDLLAEAAVTDPVENSNRPLKRRRLLREVSIPSHEASQDDWGKRPTARPPTNKGANEDRRGINAAAPTGRGLQTVEASSDEDESDFGFEDVDLAQSTTTSRAPAAEDGIADVSISLDPQVIPKGRVQARRKPATSAEKAHRLLVHKAHVLCLLGHGIYANSWCNNQVAQQNLEHLLTVKMKSYLNPKTSDLQFVRNRAFMDGLQQACEAFREQFTVTASGTRRSQWATESERDAAQPDGAPMDRSDFIKAAKKLGGSQDTGNQLFCALLRSAGVEARLVYSLQPLPLTSSPAKSSTPQKVIKPTVFAIASDTDPDKSEASADDASVRSSKSIGLVPSVRRRLGQPSFASSPAAAASPAPKAKKKAIRTLSYPVFWVEAFNAAQQKWIPVDPVLTGTVNKPSKLEPPSSYEPNQLSYAIAFESDGVAKDVTRRYAKAYNAKTRRQRVEATEGGTTWWGKAMRIFRRRGGALDREQVEDAELAQKEAREGLPSNVQDFKDHPYYALERHLKRHEVLHPRREVGKVNAGTAAKPRMEAVFRRTDVLICRSADKWYRLGREVKPGEQPLKHVTARRSLRPKAPAEEHEAGDAGPATTALYAPLQTSLYTPPPVVNGRIPRNAYGNLDIYVPSMVPAGGIHIRHPSTKEAAKLLRIDYADAVTGFTFKGRQGTAVIEGAVVSAQFADAVRTVIEGFEHGKEEEVSRERSLRALRLWKRFLMGLRIAERVSAYGDASAKGKGKERVDGAGIEKEGGGFLPDEGAVADGEMALPTAGRFSLAEFRAPAKGTARKRRKVVESEDEGYEDPANERAEDEMEDEDLLQRPEAEYNDRDDEGEGGGFIPEADTQEEGGGGGFVPDDEVRDGGFVRQEDDDEADGGFVPEAMETEEAVVSTSSHDFLGDDASGVDNNRIGEVSGLHAHHTSISAHSPEATGHGEGPGMDTQDVGDALVADEQANEDIGSMATAEVSPLEGSHTAKIFDEARSNDPAHADISNAPAADTTNQEVLAELGGGAGDGEMVAEEEEEEESDRGSLLSQDPEDEDAEPDWLDSD